MTLAADRAGALLAMLLALALAGCDAGRPVSAAPALWLVTASIEAKDGTEPPRTYLLGTVHLLPDRVNWYRGRVAQAVTKADALIVELDRAELARAAGVAARSAPRRAPLALNERLGEADAARLNRFAAENGLAPAQLATMDDWAIALTLAQASGRDAGLSPANGVDTQLIRHFRRTGRAVRGLEVAEDQFLPMENLPAPAQRAMLRQSLRDLPQASIRMRALVQAWAAGDTTALDAMVQDQAGRAAALHRAMLIRRNQRWAARLTVLAQQPGTRLVAVGAGHMAGPDGLPALIAAAGLRVERVQ